MNWNWEDALVAYFALQMVCMVILLWNHDKWHLDYFGDCACERCEPGSTPVPKTTRKNSRKAAVKAMKGKFAP